MATAASPQTWHGHGWRLPASRSVRRWWAPAAALVGGEIALAVGAAIAGPHLAKSGFTVMTAAGGLVLVGGLALTLVGAARLVRVTPRWWRLGTVAALLLLTAMVLYTLGQAVAATNVPPTQLGAASPGDHGVAYRDVDFPAADGAPLSGWYLPSRNGAAVVLLHGSGSTRSSVLDHALVLARNGYGVLLYDARGHGRSGGRAMDFGWYGDEDIVGATAFLAGQDGVDRDRIAAVGLSMGGEQAIGAAAANPRLRAVVAEGATNRVAADKDWLSSAFGLRGAFQERLVALTYQLADLLTDASPPIPLRDAVAAAAPRPFLLVTAGAVPDESSAARFIRGGSPSTTDVWTVAGASHTDGLDVAPEEWEQRVVGFLDTALGIDPQGRRF